MMHIMLVLSLKTEHVCVGILQCRTYTVSVKKVPPPYNFLQYFHLG